MRRRFNLRGRAQVQLLPCHVGADGNVNYSFGMVLDYLVPDNARPAKAYYDQDYGDSGSGNSFN